MVEYSDSDTSGADDRGQRIELFRGEGLRLAIELDRTYLALNLAVVGGVTGVLAAGAQSDVEAGLLLIGCGFRKFWRSFSGYFGGVRGGLDARRLDDVPSPVGLAA